MRKTLVLIFYPGSCVLTLYSVTRPYHEHSTLYLRKVMSIEHKRTSDRTMIDIMFVQLLFLMSCSSILGTLESSLGSCVENSVINNSKVFFNSLTDLVWSTEMKNQKSLVVYFMKLKFMLGECCEHMLLAGVEYLSLSKNTTSSKKNLYLWCLPTLTKEIFNHQHWWWS